MTYDIIKLDNYHAQFESIMIFTSVRFFTLHEVESRYI